MIKALISIFLLLSCNRAGAEPTVEPDKRSMSDAATEHPLRPAEQTPPQGCGAPNSCGACLRSAGEWSRSFRETKRPEALEKALVTWRQACAMGCEEGCSSGALVLLETGDLEGGMASLRSRDSDRTSETHNGDRLTLSKVIGFISLDRAMDGSPHPGRASEGRARVSRHHLEGIKTAIASKQ